MRARQCGHPANAVDSESDLGLTTFKFVWHTRTRMLWWCGVRSSYRHGISKSRILKKFLVHHTIATYPIRISLLTTIAIAATVGVKL